MRGKAKRKMKKPILAAAAAAAFGACAAQDGAQPAAAAELPAVTVYATRTEDSKDAVPAAVAVLTAEDIASSGARDLPDLLAKRANLDVRTLNSNPLQAQIAMRGFGENSFGRVKVLVDGEELNNVDMEAPDLSRVPLAAVERVEILHGPSPVLYGDGAVAGVVSIETAPRGGEPRTRVSARAGSQSTFGVDAHTRGACSTNGVGYSAGYGYVQSGGYRRRSAYDIHSARAAVRKDFENGSRIGVRASYGNAFYEMPGPLTYAQWKDSAKSAWNDRDSARIWNYGAGADGKFRLAEDQWLYVDTSFSSRRREASWGAYGYANEYSLYGVSLSPRYVNTMRVAGFDSKFTAGIDLRHDLYRVRDRSGYNNPRYRFNRLRQAFFAHEEFYILENLSATAGARLEHVANRWKNYAGLRENGDGDWTGDFELGLLYRPVDGMKLYVRGTRFHRSAFCDELNYTADGRFLRPETGTSLDAGAEYAFMDGFMLDFNAYGSVMDDEIFYNPYARDFGGGAWGGYNANSPSRTRRAGFDAGLSWRREGCAEASVRYSAVDASFGEGQYHGRDVPLVPKHRIRAEAGVWICEGVEVKCGFRYTGPQRLSGDYSNVHGGLAGFATFDAGIYFSPEWAKGWKASFAVDNIGDRRFCDFAGWSDYSGAYYYPACGRSFLFTVGYEF